MIDFNHDDVTPTNTGQSVLVIDLAAFVQPAVFKAAVDRLAQDIRSSERLPGVERIWLPGEQSQNKREKYAVDGIPLSIGQVSDLTTLAHELGIAPLV